MTDRHRHCCGSPITSHGVTTLAQAGGEFHAIATVQPDASQRLDAAGPFE